MENALESEVKVLIRQHILKWIIGTDSSIWSSILIIIMIKTNITRPTISCDDHVIYVKQRLWVKKINISL